METHLDNGMNEWQIFLVVDRRQAVAADYTVKFFVCLCLDLRVCGDECGEPLHDGRSLYQNINIYVTFNGVDIPFLHHQS